MIFQMIIKTKVQNNTEKTRKKKKQTPGKTIRTTGHGDKTKRATYNKKKRKIENRKEKKKTR